jgi:hypothetical protein
MLPKAYIVHQTRDRVRFRIKAKRKDSEFFDLLGTRLKSISEEVEVRVNDALGTVLFIHPGVAYADLFADLDQLEVFEIFDEREPETYALTPVIWSVKKINQAIAAATSGGVDLRTLLFVAAAVIAIRQIRRGELFSPAFTIIWSAMDMVARASKEI